MYLDHLDSKLELKDQIELHTKVVVDPKKLTSFQVTLTLMLHFINFHRL